MTQLEKSKFGNANTSYDLEVHNTYGPQNTGRNAGIEHGTGAERVLKVNLTGQMLKDIVAGDTYMPPIVIPKGALQKDAPIVVVSEAFDGTPAVTILGVDIVAADLAAVGTFATTDTASALVGTQDALPLVASGVTAGTTAAGNAELILTYWDTLITPERAGAGNGV